MKKNKRLLNLLVFFAAMLTCASLSYGYTVKDHEDEYLFLDDSDVVRGLIWELPPEIIMQQEKGTFVGREIANDSSRVIFFIDKIWDIRHTIGYEFDTNSRLWRVKFFNEKTYRDPADRMEDLMTLQNIFTERYGDPIEENFYWKNNEQRNTVENWGWAVLRGNLTVEIIWQTSDSLVRLRLEGKSQMNPEFQVIFEDRKVVDLRNTIKIEQQKPKALIPSIDFDE